MAPSHRPSPSAILLDLDGTLIDSIELIRRSYQHAVEAHGLPRPDPSFWLAGLGRPLAWQFGELVDDPDEVDALIKTYRAFNREHHDDLVEAYPGAVEAVRAVHAADVPLGIVTSKAHASALRGLEISGFDPAWFGAVVASDDVAEHKPHPAPVLRALEELNVAAGKAVMVGDSPHDLAAGRAAGAQTAAVAWGPFPEADLRACEPDHWLAEPAALARL